jgi:Bacteriophage Mu Gp45 spike protein
MRESVASIRERTSAAATMLRGTVRRLVADAAEGAVWKLLGYLDSDGKRETFDAESFQHVGFGSRAPGQAEVIVVHVGGEAEHPVIVATRDRSTQVALAKDETAIWNSKVIVKITADGVVEIGTPGAALTPLDELVHGRGIDTFTGATYKVLGSTTSKVRAEK